MDQSAGARGIELKGEKLKETSTGQGGEEALEIDEVRAVLSRAVKKFCPARLGSEREDLVQAACLRILGRSKSIEESGRFEASYLWRVAHSVVMDEIRRRMRRPEAPLVDPDPAQPHHAGSTPEAAHQASRLRDTIVEGLGTLKEPRRQAVILYLHGFSLQESARVLGWKAKRVDNQRYQGLAQLRDYLAKKGVTP